MGLHVTRDDTRPTEYVEDAQALFPHATLDAVDDLPNLAEKRPLVPDVRDDLPRQIVSILFSGVPTPQRHLSVFAKFGLLLRLHYVMHASSSDPKTNGVNCI